MFLGFQRRFLLHEFQGWCCNSVTVQPLGGRRPFRNFISQDLTPQIGGTTLKLKGKEQQYLQEYLLGIWNTEPENHLPSQRKNIEQVNLPGCISFSFLSYEPGVFCSHPRSGTVYNRILEPENT